MKIFSIDHVNVKNFANSAYDAIKEFLEEHGQLEIGVREHSFTFQGEVFHKEMDIGKSLPYLFFKDGMEILYFYKGLTVVEFFRFLIVVLENLRIPPEEGDVVFSIWVMDFAHISYYATDQILTAKIGSGIAPLDYKVDKESLHKGEIDLFPEDLKALESGDLMTWPQNIAQGLSEEDDSEGRASGVEQELTELEIEKLEAMLAKNRSITVDDEMISIYMEMLYLEERKDYFPEVLENLAYLRDDLMKRGDFGRSAKIMSYIASYKSDKEVIGSAKSRAIEDFFEKSKTPKSLDKIKESFSRMPMAKMQSFFEYISHLGAAAVPLVCDIYEEKGNEVFLENTFDYFKEIIKSDVAPLLQVVDRNSPDLTEGVIYALGYSTDKRAVIHLRNFLDFPNLYIKRHALDSLGRIDEVSAARTVSTYLSDKNSSLRIHAVKNLRYFPDKALLLRVIDALKPKPFLKRTMEEMDGLLSFLGRSDEKETYEVFEQLVMKSGGLFQTSKTAVALKAINVLHSMKTKKAAEVLRKGAKSRNKIIRQACLEVLSGEQDA